MNIFTRSIVGLVVATIFLTSTHALANSCATKLTSTSRMTFDMKEIVIPKSCKTFEITLYYDGKLDKKVMGHNVVISDEASMPAIIKAAIPAGAKSGFVPKLDEVLANSKLLSGGESDTFSFSTEKFEEGVNYVFYCTFPGHSALMKGKITIK